MRAPQQPRFDRPRRLRLLFAVVTVLPAAGLVWLGMALITQDKELAVKQLRDDLDRRADVIALEVSRDLARPAPPPGPTSSAPDDRRATELAIRARDLRNANRSDEALAVWMEMKTMDDVRVFGDPASLQAGLARVRELKARGRIEERDREAAEIREGLARGRWQIDKTSIETAWSQVASPDVFVPAWSSRWRERGLAARVIDASGNDIISTGTLSEPIVTRSLVESGLPWTLSVSSASPDAELAAAGTRRTQLLLVLSLAAFLAVAGAYFVARGMRRELAVAQLQSSFVSAVSHEFRTPLTSMSHLVELLRTRPGLDDVRRAKYYDALEQEAARLRRFVDQLLDFGRVDAGQARYSLEAADARPIVEDIVERFRSGPAALGHVVTCHSNGHAATVALDREAFSLALNNLLENAAKYSPVEKPIDVNVGVGATSDKVAVTVRDFGGGIPKSEHQIIFDKFVRGASAQQSTIRGTGVGLALAREIIRAHGGDIRVESEVGQGTAFSIELPLQQRADV